MRPVYRGGILPPIRIVEEFDEKGPSGPFSFWDFCWLVAMAAGKSLSRESENSAPRQALSFFFPAIYALDLGQS